MSAVENKKNMLEGRKEVKEKRWQERLSAAAWLNSCNFCLTKKKTKKKEKRFMLIRLALPKAIKSTLPTYHSRVIKKNAVCVSQCMMMWITCHYIIAHLTIFFLLLFLISTFGHKLQLTHANSEKENPSRHLLIYAFWHWWHSHIKLRATSQSFISEAPQYKLKEMNTTL